ncbi:MAG: outer membrane beta-barrel protein [Myxococcota bacterium]
MTPTRPPYPSADPRRSSVPLLLAGGPRLRARSPRPLRAGIVAALLALLVAPIAAADDHDDEGYANYFEFQAGAAWVPNQTIKNGGTLGSIQLDEPGYHVGGAIGRQFTDLIRAEFAVSYREGDVDQAGFASGTQADGKSSLTAVMINAYADFPMGPFTPWIGFGIGGGEYKVDVIQKAPGVLDIDDADAVFVYNAMVGASVPLSEVATLNFGYRYIAIAGEQNTEAVTGGPGSPSVDFDSEFDAHEGIVGIRFSF